MANLELDTPVGKVTLDGNRQAVAATFINEVIEGADGNLKNEFISMDPAVTQTLGMDAAAFAALGAPSRDNPAASPRTELKRDRGATRPGPTPKPRGACGRP